MTKAELKAALENGATLESLLEFRAGQECEIYKAEKFLPGNTVLYIPDLSLNEIPTDRPISDPEELEDVLDQCYTGDDFIDECSGDAELAERLFWFCDWQTPSAQMGEGFGTDEEKTADKADDSMVLWGLLSKHLGHRVSIAAYGDPDDPADVCLECEDCGEVILDAGLYTTCARSEARPDEE